MSAMVPNNHQVHSWVYSHVELVLVFVGYSEPVPLVEMTCGINLNNRKRNCFGLVGGVRQQCPKNLCSDAAPLHFRHHIERTKINSGIVNLLLNPPNTSPVSSYDPRLIELEEPSEVFLLPHLVPTEQTLDYPAHGRKVHGAGKCEVLIARCSEVDVHCVLQKLIVRSESYRTSLSPMF